MTTQPGRRAPDDDQHDDSDEPAEVGDAFAGLTAIDIIDGELVPRRRPVR